MLALKRRLYRLILRLHPAAFRNRFAREMALDFEDALATYGFSRLLADATRSLARQWTKQILAPETKPTSHSRASLLAGNYPEIQDEPMRPLELARGFIASASLLTLCCFAFSAGPGHIPQVLTVYASPAVPVASASMGKAGPASLAGSYPAAMRSEQGVSSSPAAGLALGADGKPLVFDVVSVREDKSVLSPENPISIGATRDGYQVKGLPLLAVIQDTYIPSEANTTFKPGDIIGAPAWFSSTRYDIDAKIAAADLQRWSDPAQQSGMRRAMLQTMLADRFKLVAHRETIIMPIFELSLGKNPPKFRPSEAETLDQIRQKHPNAQQLIGGAIVAGGPNPGQQTFFGVTMSEFCGLLRNLAGRTVRDHTGLTGKYDISYQLELLPPQAEGGAPVPPDPYSLQIHTIIEDQLGLKLTSTKGPVEVLVIDHIEKPSEN